MKRLAVLFALLVLASGCSTQYREAAPQIESEDLFSLIEEFNDPKVNSLNIDLLAQDNSQVIFHARQDEDRPAASVLSMADMSILDSAWGVGTPSNYIGLTAVDALFIDNTSANSGRSFSLLIKWQEQDSATPFYFASTSVPDSARFTDTEFQVEMRGASGEILIVRTNDLSEKYNEELASSIKLNIYVVEGGIEYYAGHISTMAGFDNL